MVSLVLVVSLLVAEVLSATTPANNYKHEDCKYKCREQVDRCAVACIKSKIIKLFVMRKMCLEPCVPDGKECYLTCMATD